MINLEMLNRIFGRQVAQQRRGKFVGRRFTQDVAIPFRMGAGAPGDVNRTHPADIPPFLVDPTNPPAGYGFPGLINTASNGLRGVLASDSSESMTGSTRNRAASQPDSKPEIGTRWNTRENRNWPTMM